MYGQQPPNPPGNWGPPPPPGGYGPPGGPGGYGPPPPPPRQPPPRRPSSGLPPRAILVGIGVAVMGIAITIMIVVGVVQHGRSYVLFDANGADCHARLDGKDIGSAKTPSATRVEAGAHRFELVDARGVVVASTAADVPDGGWRGVVTSAPATRYAIVTVTYNSSSKPVIKLFQRRGPALHVLTDGNVVTMEMETLGTTFPATGKKDTSSTLLCRVDPTGQPECLR